MHANHIARKLTINGIVQGVGFRPFVYHLAHQCGVAGEIANTAGGVFIHVEGIQDQIDDFCRELSRQGPPLARITEIRSSPDPVAGFREFSIVPSRGQARRATLISPDVAVCDDCLRELFDPADRRFQYPFINCTNCGPRYTIIADLPYDRPNTAMHRFRLCQRCRAEYEDPANRRFHAQPNACRDCGPRVGLHDRQGHALETPDPILQAAALLKQGFIVALKGLGGFHLSVDAANHDAVRRLRERKQRPAKPLAVMAFDLDRVRSFAHLADRSAALLASSPRPIVLLPKREPTPLSPAIAPGVGSIGAMLPYTPLHYLLLQHEFQALVMTSGNPSGAPICTANADAFRRLGRIADYFLVHDREIYLRADDSVVKPAAGAARLMRRARGYVPAPILLDRRVPPILACGGELKNTVCLTKANQAFVSQHIGDLGNLETYDFFRRTIDHLQRILDIRPSIVACDLHPDYLSSRYAAEYRGARTVRVQHHHAHIAACMAEHRLPGPVLGIALDGTGYGDDGHIWGGEVLIADYHRYRRAAHLAYVPMPGGDAAIREPWRMALSYLHATYGPGWADLDLPLLRDRQPLALRTVATMIARRLNAPLTSSLGRLFDAVAALVGVRSRISFEGQAAMELEALALADRTALDSYEVDWRPGVVKEIRPQPLIRGIVRDLQEGVAPSVISAKFHRTLIDLFTDLCKALRRETGLEQVALGGGVFQNGLLLEGMLETLGAAGFRVHVSESVPVNDGGLALGQAVVAAARAVSEG